MPEQSCRYSDSPKYVWRSFIEGSRRYPKWHRFDGEIPCSEHEAYEENGNERQGAAIWYASKAGIRHKVLFMRYTLDDLELAAGSTRTSCTLLLR